MVSGYNGKVLFIDLTTGAIKEESLPEKVYRDFIGGQGLGARILYERIKPLLDDSDFKVAETYVAQERVAAEDWDAPEMSVYDDL